MQDTLKATISFIVSLLLTFGISWQYIRFNSLAGLLLLVVGSFLGALYIIGIVTAILRRRNYHNLKKYTVTIPEFKLDPGVELYEAGVLTDGKLHDRDILATAMHYYLNQHTEKEIDDIEHEIIDKYKDKENLFYLYYELSEGADDKRSKYKSLVDSFTIPIYDRIKFKGFIRYNPRKVESWASRITILLMFVAFLIVYFYVKVLDYDMNYLGAVFFANLILFTAGLTTLFVAIFAYQYHENYEKILPIRLKLLGHRQYLKVADFYRVQKDKELFEREMPLFIILNIFKKNWHQLFQHILRYHIPNGTVEYKEFSRKLRNSRK